MIVGQGMARVDAVWEVRITEQTYYRWRKQRVIEGAIGSSPMASAGWEPTN